MQFKLWGQKVYCFHVYHNERTKRDYLLFKGVGFINGNEIQFLNEYDYMVTQYNFSRLNNYYDIVKKIGEFPCVVIDENNIIIDSFFQNQKEIQKKYNLTVSSLYSRPFKENDTIKLQKISELKQVV